jgi:hypothetical protein
MCFFHGYRVRMHSPDSFYVGPGKSRLVAASFDDIVTAAASGCLDETQWVELKRDIPSSSKPANLELAKDLASLSVDGGVLICGHRGRQRIGW